MVQLATAVADAFAPMYDEMKLQGAVGLRTAAWETFATKGLPNRRVESWHYTDLKAALARPAPLAIARGGVEVARAHDSIRLVVLDGAFRPELSDLAALPRGVTVQPLREALAQGTPGVMALLASDDVRTDDALISLNTALMQDGVILRIGDGVTIERPIEIAGILSSEDARSSFTRSLVVLGKGARATIIETAGVLTDVPAQDNQALIVRLASGASLDLFTHATGQSETQTRVMSLVAHLDEGAAFSAFSLIEGAGLLRRQIFARVDGEHARLALQGATMARGRDHVDVTLVVDHAKPNGQSRERFRNILDGNSAGVFQGKIIVRPGAQKTDGVMQSKAVLLSDGATMNNKPELEIFADDVQCGHGATCGRLDKDQLFYLMARGLPRGEAEALLIEGFANEAFEGLGNEPLRGFISARISQWMSGRAA
ncbi:MAG: Fe-S cluster assembly protein SufD [Methylocystis sp.]|uniref:Fe-S cluster assembly protein SufD n=1 Tax=Methylocystis sp. TaxID=1911079 RepID=UPI00392E1CB7